MRRCFGRIGENVAAIEALHLALFVWAEICNRERLIERHRFKPPAEAPPAYREKLVASRVI